MLDIGTEEVYIKQLFLKKNNKAIKIGLIALFPLSFANYAILHPPLFFERFAPHLLPIVLCSKLPLKEGKWGKR